MNLSLNMIWIVTGWDQVITARAVTFIAAMGMAVAVTLLAKEPVQADTNR